MPPRSWGSTSTARSRSRSRSREASPESAGLLYLIEFNIRYDTGFELGLIAFTAAVLGGIGNLTGAVLGALIIGLIQAFNEGLGWAAPGSDWTRSIVFGLLIAILVFRPGGPARRENARGGVSDARTPDADVSKLEPLDGVFARLEPPAARRSARPYP